MGLIGVACSPHPERQPAFVSAPVPRPALVSAPTIARSDAPQPVVAKTALEADEIWATLALSDGSTVEVRAQHPRAKLDQLGVVSFAISGKGKAFVVTGLKNICGDVSALVSRAGQYDDTEVTLEQVASRGSLLLFSVTIETHSGEDVQEGYLQTALWLVDSARVESTPRRVWSGSGGEYHRYFEACAFVSEVSYELDAFLNLTRRCRRVAERDPEARNYPDCADGPTMECENEALGALNAIRQ